MAQMKRRDPGGLKRQIELLVARLGGLEEAAAASEGLVSKSHLHRAGDPDKPRVQLAVDVLLKLEREAGEPVVTAWHLRELGWGLFPIEIEGGNGDALSRELAAACREAGEVAAVIVEAMADGRITRAEAGPALEEIDRCLNAFGRLRARVQALHEAGESGEGGGG